MQQLLLLLLLIQSKWIQYASKHRQVSRLFVRYLLLLLFHQRQFWWCNAMHHRVYCQTNDMTNASVWKSRATAHKRKLIKIPFICCKSIWAHSKHHDIHWWQFLCVCNFKQQPTPHENWPYVNFKSILNVNLINARRFGRVKQQPWN